MSAPRKRTNEQILSSLACNYTEAAQVLNVGWETIDRLVKAKEIRSYPSGKRNKIIVRSLMEYQERAAV